MRAFAQPLIVATPASRAQIVLGNGVGSVELDLALGSPLVVDSSTSGGGSQVRRLTRRRARVGALLSASPLFRFSPGPSNNANDGAVSMHAYVRLADALSTAAGLPRPPIRGVLSTLTHARAEAIEGLLGVTPGSVDAEGGFTVCPALHPTIADLSVAEACGASASNATTSSLAAVVSAEVGGDEVPYLFACIPRLALRVGRRDGGPFVSAAF